MKKLLLFATVMAVSVTCFAAEPASNIPVLGEKQQVEAAEKEYRITLANMTGRTIKGIQIKDIYAGSYPDNLLVEEAVVADKEKTVICFYAADKQEFNIRITFEDDSIRDMTSFPYSDMTEAELLFDDDLLHAVYTSLKSGKEEDTLDREKAFRDAAQRAKEVEYDDDYDYDDGGQDYGGGGGVDECIANDDALLW